MSCLIKQETKAVSYLPRSGLLEPAVEGGLANPLRFFASPLTASLALIQGGDYDRKTDIHY